MFTAMHRWCMHIRSSVSVPIIPLLFTDKRFENGTNTVNECLLAPLANARLRAAVHTVHMQ